MPRFTSGDYEKIEAERPRPWLCIRCRTNNHPRAEKCAECGVGKERRVQRIKKRAKIGGKRGRNSGKVSQHGK